MSHGHCYLWKPELVWLHAGSDFLIALSYYSIPLLLVYFVRRRHDVPFQGIFFLFSTFILSCGTTHLIEIWTLWHPYYWVSGLMKAITAIASLYTASELVSLLPQALALPSPAQLEAANYALEKEIAEHRQTVAALKQSQQRLSLLVQQTPMAVIEWNLNGEVSEWNPAAETMFGYKKSEVIGQHASTLMVPQCDKEQFNKIWQDLLSCQSGSCNSNQHYTPDDRSLFCEWYNIPLIEPNGSCVGVASLVQDITKRKEAEDALRRANEELEQRVEKRTHELFQTNEVLQMGRVSEFPDQERVVLERIGLLSLLVLPLTVNEQFFGFIVFGNCEEARVWSASEVDLLRAAAAALSLQHERSKAEVALRQSEAQLREQATQLEQTLHQLKTAQAQLVQSEKMSSLGLMVAGIAHEINNPVCFVYGNLTPASEYIQELLDLVDLYRQHYPVPVPAISEYTQEIDLDFLMEDLPDLLESMKVGAERIRDIVASLRTFSRLDEAKMKRVNIHEGLDSTLLILQHRLREKRGRPRIQVIKKYASLPLVECYAGQLNQVFTNILANAIDALESHTVSSEQVESEILSPPSSPCIQICTEIVDSLESHQDSKNVVIRIRDNGLGMTESVRLRLFDPFFTTKPVGQGTGLGLSISYQIVVAEHGGELRCVSAPGQGTEFCIQIPIQQPNVKSSTNGSVIPDSQMFLTKERQLRQYPEQTIEINPA